MNPNSFAYIHYTAIPGSTAHSVYVVKSIQGTLQAGVTGYLISPQSPIKTSIWLHYRIKPNSFQHHSIHNFLVPPVSLKPTPQLIHSLKVLIFGLFAWKIAYQKGVEIVQTANPELIVIFALLSTFYRPQLIFDAHLPLPNWLNRYLAARVDLFITTTRIIAQQLKDLGMSPLRILTLPMGYDPEAFKSSYQSKQIRNDNFNTTDFVIGYIGRFITLDLEKGIFLLLDSLVQISNKKVKAFIIGGPESQLAKYRAHAQKLGIMDRVVFQSQVPTSEVVDYLYTFNLAWMVYPRHRHFEAYMSPMKMIEYAAAGLPTIASDFPSITDHLLSRNLYLVNPDQPAEILQTIKSITHDYPKAQKKAQKAKAQVKQYTWKNRQGQIFSRLNSLTKLQQQQ